jgi:uncharacterized protein (DUF305 family)
MGAMAEQDVVEPRPAPARATGLPGVKVAILVAAVAFLAGSIGFVVGERNGGADPLNASDVGFMQDMGLHHDQAVQMSLILLDKPEIDRSLKAFAQEIIISQRYEQGVFVALLDRFGHPTEGGDTVMGWMGEPMAADEMTGLATPEQIEALRDAEGDEAASLWIALMSEHHLAGLHMADHATRHGGDETVVNLATSMVTTQRGEVIDLARYRRNNDLALPAGFDDPMEDQRLDPIAFRDQAED